VLFVDETDYVIEDENAFDCVAHRFGLRFQPINDQSRATIN
jgi:hypothetical protein